MNSRVANKFVLKDPIVRDSISSLSLSLTEKRLSVVEEKVGSLDKYIRVEFQEILVNSIREIVLSLNQQQHTDNEESSSSILTPDELVDKDWQESELSKTVLKQLSDQTYFEDIAKMYAPFVFEFRYY